MRVSKKATLLTLLFFSGLLFFLVLYAFQQVKATTEKLVYARKIAENSFNLNYLTHDYLVNPTERIEFQWNLAYVKLRRQVNYLQERELEPYPRKIVSNIEDRTNSVRHYFNLIIAFSGLGKEAGEEKIGLGQKELTQIAAADLHQLVLSVFTLEAIFREDFLNTQRQTGFWLLSVISLFFLTLVISFYRLFEEIKQRIRSQKRLTEANEKLRLVDRLVEFTGDGVYRCSCEQGKILYANQGFVDILELDCSPTEVVGKHLGEIIQYLEEPGTIRGLTEKRGSIRNYPYRFKTLGGRDKWVLCDSFLVQGPGNEKVLEAIITDVTEKRKIEERNKFLAGILNSAPLSVIATDGQRRIIYTNPATAKLFGYSQDELLGKDPLVLNAEPDREGIEDEIFKVVQKDKIYTRRIRNRKKNGEVFTVEVSIYKLEDKNGDFVALVGFQKDVTQEIKAQQEVEESELKFRTIFEKAGCAIFVADPETKVISDCNKRAEELMGFSRKELIGRKQYCLHPKGREEEYKKIFSKHIEAGEVNNFPGQIQDKQGDKKSVWINAQLFKFGGKSRLVGFFTDLSPRLELEKKEKEALEATTAARVEQAKAEELEKAYNELKETQEKLVKTEKMAALGRLSAMVAHDLRNPLAVIRNSIYILKRSLSSSQDEKIKKYIRILDEEIGVADTIIEEILSFGRLKNIKLAPFKLNKTLDKLLEKTDIPKIIKVEKDFDQNISLVRGDKEQLQRVFTNIIRNAVEAMTEGGKLGISTGLQEDIVLIEISDTGVGISQKDANKIFEPMYSTKIHGTGLGLSACKNIIEAHSGHITAKSKKGKGTVVTVVLPFKPGEKQKK